jgi:hypothetical protein
MEYQERRCQDSDVKYPMHWGLTACMVTHR